MSQALSVKSSKVQSEILMTYFTITDPPPLPSFLSFLNDV